MNGRSRRMLYVLIAGAVVATGSIVLSVLAPAWCPRVIWPMGALLAGLALGLVEGLAAHERRHDEEVARWAAIARRVEKENREMLDRMVRLETERLERMPVNKGDER